VVPGRTEIRVNITDANADRESRVLQIIKIELLLTVNRTDE
jgi:hypothetical protein